MTGRTSSGDFPLVNALQPRIGGAPDAFVTKLSPDGAKLIYSTYLGGSAADGGQGIAVDASGNAYVTGRTFAPFFGGSGNDVGNGITADAAGNAYVTGGCGSRGFPATALPGLSKGQGAFIVKIAPTGSMPLISARGVTKRRQLPSGTGLGRDCHPCSGKESSMSPGS